MRSPLRACLLASVLAAVVGACDRAPELQPVPFPDLVAVEPDVRQDLERRRAELEQLALQSERPAVERAKAYGEAGMVYHSLTLREAAEACYRNAQALDPDAFAWAYYLGQVQRDDNRLEPAAASFREALEIDPRYAPAQVALGEVELARDRMDDAEPAFREALELDPSNVPALIGLGRVAAARNDPAAAVTHFERALSILPAASEIHYPLGLAYRALGREEEARAQLEQRGNVKAVQPDPLMAELERRTVGWRAAYDRATALFAQGDFEQALPGFRAAAEASPEDASVQLNLGAALVMLGNVEGGRAAFEKALQLDPTLALARFNLGTLLARQGDDDRAIEQYRTALEQDPNLKDARFNLANALRRRGRNEEASREYALVVEADPPNVPARLGETIALVRLGRYDQALVRLEEAHRVLPQDRQILNALTRLLAAAPDDGVRDGTRALELAKQLVAEGPELSYVETFAMAAAEIGVFDRAVEWQERALEAAQQAGRQDLVAGIQGNLERYRKRMPCRKPWREDELQPVPIPSRPSAAGVPPL